MQCIEMHLEGYINSHGEYTATVLNYVRFHDQVSLACDNSGSAYSSTFLLSICLTRNEKAAG